MKSIIPIKLYIILLLLVASIIFLFYFYFGISQLKIEDLSENILSEIIGILITLVIVEQLINKHEKNKWAEFDERINSQLFNLLSFMYNILFLHMKKMEIWISQNNFDNSKQEKLKTLSQLSLNQEPDSEYIKTTIDEDYLNGWYIKMYTALLTKTDFLFQNYQSRLGPDQLTLLLDQKDILSTLTNNMELGHAFNSLEKDQNITIPNKFIEDIKTDILKLLSISNALVSSLTK